jgi:2-dehydropantoate 2-reductase
MAVYGAGAIGSQIGARIHAAGHDVTLVEPWEPHRRAIAERGLTIHAPGGGDTYWPVVVSPDELPTFTAPIDLLFLSVKSYDTLEAMERVTPYLAAGGIVVSMQNSINEEWIAPLVGASRVVGGVILINAVLLEPGHVTETASVSRATSAGDLPGVYVGEYSSAAGAKANDVASVLDAVWPTKPIDDLLHERWSKLANNTMINPVSGIGGLRSAAALADPNARRTMIAVASEVLRVAEAEGYPLARVMGDYDAADVRAGAEGRSDSVDRALAARAEKVSDDATTSMLQDVLRGRKTEIDYFSGFVARKGSAHGIPTPYCDAVTRLVHRVEAGTLAPSPEALLEVRKLVGD